MSKPPETIGRATLWQGDCREVLATFDADSIDAVVTDPPYHLTTAKRGGSGIASLNLASPAGRSRIGTGFMGKAWDGGDIAVQPEMWRLVFDAMKPGAHLAAFGGTRTFHRMTCAIEDAGLEIRDSLCWLYGSGFPKSHNLDGDWQGWGTALKPAWEPIILARKPLIGTVAQNVLAHGTGGINVDACRVAVGANDRHDYGVNGDEPSVAGNGITHGHRARVAYERHTAGRWPANVLHDGSDEVEAAFAAFGSSASSAHTRNNTVSLGSSSSGIYGAGAGSKGVGIEDAGSASRFFASCPFSADELRFHYSGKADADDRAGSRHPTIKPISLMRWLVRLITPPGGTVLDPFAGSGTTGEAAMLEGCNAVLIEREAAYMQDIRHRLGRVSGADTPLFADTA